MTTSEHPTFQELRDGQQYRTRDGRVVKVVGPTFPGQPIYTMVVETGENYYCATTQLFKI